MECDKWGLCGLSAYVSNRGPSCLLCAAYADTRIFFFSFAPLRSGVSQVVLVVRNPPANAGDIRDVSSIPPVGKVSWRRAWQPTPLFLPGECHGQGTLAGYSPWAHKESDITGVTEYTCTPDRWVLLLLLFPLRSSHGCKSPLSLIADLNLQALPPFCVAIL